MTSRRGDRRAASKACPKQGVCPASRSSHTIPAHHPGHYHHSSGSPHPDTRGWAQTATPRPQPPHSEDGQRSPPLWRLSPSYLHQHLARRCPGTAAIRKRPTTRRHAWGSSGDGGSEALLQEIWRRPQRCMNKFAISSLLGASATGLPRFADVLRTCTMMVQEIVTMIVTMGLRVKAQTPAAQRMTRKSS